MVARTFALGAAMAAVAQAAAMYGNGTTVTTTEVVQTLTTYCPGPTTLTYGDKTYTVTKAMTLTITDCPCTLTKPVVTPTGPAQDECSKHCTDEFNSCRTAPDANMSYCAAMYAKCLGYNPWENDTFVTPTACSAQPTETVYTTEVVQTLTTYCPEATTLTQGNKTYTVTKPTTLTITDCPCTVTKPIPMPQPTGPAPSGQPGQPQPSQAPPAGDCPAECATAYNSCRTAPDANMSTCAAEYAKCLGYNPFGEDGSLITPTACSSAVNPPPASTGTPTGPNTVPTAGAGRVVPGALVALGAIALL